ncbi:hypothetical protein GCM10027265_19310 [Jatrophihabitans fulvus]
MRTPPAAWVNGFAAPKGAQGSVAALATPLPWAAARASTDTATATTDVTRRARRGRRDVRAGDPDVSGWAGRDLRGERVERIKRNSGDAMTIPSAVVRGKTAVVGDGAPEGGYATRPPPGAGVR